MASVLENFDKQFKATKKKVIAQRDNAPEQTVIVDPGVESIVPTTEKPQEEIFKEERLDRLLKEAGIVDARKPLGKGRGHVIDSAKRDKSYR